MLVATHRFTWLPLYLLIIGYVCIDKATLKNRILNLIYIIASVGLADRFTSGFMKPYFARLRPCHDHAISNILHLVGDCGGQYGFASSHASNSFALAICFWLLYRKQNKFAWILFIWAALVSYSRVYVGVHYPSDILGGAVIGALLALLGHKLISFNR